MRSIFLLLAYLCLFSTAASAAPSTNQMEVTEEAKALLGAARSHVTSVQATFRSDIQKTESSQLSKERALNQQSDNQRKALQLLEGELTKADTELFTSNAQLLINPSLVGFSEQLVSMTNYYREQSGFPAGPETLSCGPSCEYYQKRRDALSNMIAGLRDELFNIASVVAKRRQTVELIAQELDTVYGNPSSSLVRFGFDHFINQRIAQLEGQSLIVEDIQRLGAKTNFAGQPESVPQPCFPGVFLYRSFLDDIRGLANTTTVWQAPVDDVLQRYAVGLWTQGRTGALGPLRELLNRYVGYFDANGVYMPGWRDNWSGCSNSNKNVIKNQKTFIEADFGLGEVERAKILDEQTLELQLEVDAIDAQLERLRQFEALLGRLGTIAGVHAVSPKSGEAWSDMWKTSVLSEIKNFERLSVANREVLIATQRLLRLAEDQVAPLGTITDPAMRAAQLLTARRRLEVIAKSGFQRLELELSLAAGSLDTMSGNIRSSEGSNDEGGLGLAISAYYETTLVRNDSMKQEQKIELPLRKKLAEGKVSELEKSRATTVALLTEIGTKQATLRGLIDERKKLGALMEGFFKVRVSHPFYLDLSRKFVAELKLKKSAVRTFRKPIEEFIKNFYTVGFATPSSQRPSVTALGKRAQRLREQYRRRIAKVSDDVSTPQLGGIPFSGVIATLKNVRARSSSL